MKDQVVETPSQDVTEASATELLNHSFFNDFDMQILQLQSEIEYRIEERKKRAILLKHEIDAQLTEFETRWFEEIFEASSLNVKSLKHGIRAYGYEAEGSTFGVTKYTSAIVFNFMLKSFEFDVERCDEFEDIDVNDFILRSYRVDKDELMKINIVFAELESLIPYLVRWNREVEALQSELQVKVMQINFELGDMDGEIKQLRQQIHELRIASFLAGNVVDFNDNRTRRLYYRSRKFEYVDQVRLVSLSASGKTCSFEAITLEKGFRSTYYYAKRGTKAGQKFEGVRVSTLVANFYEAK